MTYDFASLSDYDFEVLVRDLLSARDGQRYESFKAGRDKGIDLRCLKSGTTIAQCKHWIRSGFAALKRDVESREAPKVRTLAPDRYLLITSVPLSAGNKSDLSAALSPFVASDDDILGQEDLNALLREFPLVERAHPKLWLTSAVVLDRLVNAGVYARTTRKAEDIKRSARLYVQNRSFAEARRRLREFHVCVIAGPPGIGKTMLADMLLLHYLSEDYEPILVSQDASEADEVMKAERKQIFLYDDFLGRTNLVEHFNKNEDSRLSQLIHQVHGSSGKRLVLTTREYILRDAQVQYDVLEAARLDPMKIIIDLSHYTRREKAQIFYNHLFFSDLPRASLKTLVDSRAYHKIIGHRNYSPRLIEHVTSMAINAGHGDDKFGEFVLETLENPGELWRQVFNSINRIDQSTLLSLVSFRGSVEMEVLYRALCGFSQAQNAGRPDRWSFEQALRRLEGTFIDIDSDSNDRNVDFRDPSLRDFLLHYLDAEPSELVCLIEGATEFEQLQLIAAYGRAGRQDGVPDSLQYDGIASTIRRTNTQFAEQMLALVQGTAEAGSLDGRERDTRAAACAWMSPQLASETLDEWLMTELFARSTEWREETGPRDAVILIARAVGALDEERQIPLRPVLAAAKEVCTTLGDDVVSYRDFVGLAEGVPTLLEAEDFRRAREEFRAFAEYEIERLADCEDPDELREGIDDLDYVSVRLRVNIGRDLDRLHEILADYTPEDYEDWDEPEREGPSALEIETQEIDLLFESLVDDEPH